MTIKAAIFSNRIEVKKPGDWPLGLRGKDFRNGVVRARNPVIAGVLHKLTITENWGSGFKRIETAARQLGCALPAPTCWPSGLSWAGAHRIGGGRARPGRATRARRRYHRCTR